MKVSNNDYLQAVIKDVKNKKHLSTPEKGLLVANYRYSRINIGEMPITNDFYRVKDDWAKIGRYWGTRQEIQLGQPIRNQSPFISKSISSLTKLQPSLTEFPIYETKDPLPTKSVITDTTVLGILALYLLSNKIDRSDLHSIQREFYTNPIQKNLLSTIHVEDDKDVILSKIDLDKVKVDFYTDPSSYYKVIDEADKTFIIQYYDLMQKLQSQDLEIPLDKVSRWWYSLQVLLGITLDDLDRDITLLGVLVGYFFSYDSAYNDSILRYKYFVVPTSKTARPDLSKAQSILEKATSSYQKFSSTMTISYALLDDNPNWEQLNMVLDYFNSHQDELNEPVLQNASTVLDTIYDMLKLTWQSMNLTPDYSIKPDLKAKLATNYELLQSSMGEIYKVIEGYVTARENALFQAQLDDGFAKLRTSMTKINTTTD